MKNANQTFDTALKQYIFEKGRESKMYEVENGKLISINADFEEEVRTAIIALEQAYPQLNFI